jgi:Lon protease-like protein
MVLPPEMPVMTLPNAILFPQALLPLYIFERRYQQMLADCLHSHRMFAVAMRRPGVEREIPMSVAGVGLIRASVRNKDGTSHLILQGLSRVALKTPVHYKPYRRQAVSPLLTTGQDSLAIHTLTGKVLELVTERFQRGFSLPVHLVKELGFPQDDTGKVFPSKVNLKQIMDYLAKLESPDQLADLVSCTLLPAATDRQTILETVNLEDRLNHLIRFLRADLRHSKGSKGKKA